MGWGHFRAGSARGPRGAAAGLPDRQTIRSAPRRWQVMWYSTSCRVNVELSVGCDMKYTIKCGLGSGGRMKVCSAQLREMRYAPHLCPASSVTTQTSGWCPLTPSHTHSIQTTCCPVHTSATWTSQHGEKLTPVLATEKVKTIKRSFYLTCVIHILPIFGSLFQTQSVARSRAWVWVSLFCVNLRWSISVLLDTCFREPHKSPVTPTPSSGPHNRPPATVQFN